MARPHCAEIQQSRMKSNLSILPQLDLYQTVPQQSGLGLPWLPALAVNNNGKLSDTGGHGVRR
jgi:hypothetical protein